MMRKTKAERKSKSRTTERTRREKMGRKIIP
jgi:hypothetical protein